MTNNTLEVPPIQATKELLDVSVTERSQFRTCRRRWKLQTLDNLEPKVPDLALPFGTGMHSALECYYTNEDRVETVQTFEQWVRDEIKKWEKGGASDDALDELYEAGKLGVKMLYHYFHFDEVSKVSLGEVLLVEGERQDEVRGLIGENPKGYGPKSSPVRHESGRILVPIVNPKTKKPLKGNPCLSARLDLVTERKTPQKGLWVVDHKTASSAPDISGVEFDDQFTGYDYVLWRLTGVIPRGVVHNILIKKEIKDPRWNKGDKLSYAKDQLTTPDQYREAIKEAGLMGAGGTILSEPHAECLDALLARGYDPWFRRVETTRNIQQLESFEYRLWQEYQDMQQVKDNPDLQYPNPIVAPFGVCQSCPVNRICLAMEDGSDWQSVRDVSYQEAEDRKA